MKHLICGLAAASLLAGCATRPRDIAPAYVSSVPYQGFSCNQLRQEAQAVSRRAGQAVGQQEKQASADAAMVGVSLILFWPAAFFVGGDKTAANDIAQLKGEMQAIQEISDRKNCGIRFQAQ